MYEMHYLSVLSLWKNHETVVIKKYKAIDARLPSGMNFLIIETNESSNIYQNTLRETNLKYSHR